MALGDSVQFGQNTSDNQNPADNTVPIPKTHDEVMRMEEGASLTKTQTIGHSFILSHSVNGVLGVANGVDGSQIVLGEAGRGDLILAGVVNQNNLFKENFRVNVFEGAGNADWDTTLYRLASSTSSNHSIPHQSYHEFNVMFKNDETILRATVFATETRWNPNDKIAYFLSADGGNNYEEVQLRVEHIFVNTGEELKGKVVFFGNGGKDTYIELYKVQYGVVI